MSLAVVTDSAACLTEPLLRERAIEVVPLHAIPACLLYTSDAADDIL